MEFLHILFAHLETFRNVVMAIPERKLLPFAFFAPIVFFGIALAWTCIKQRNSNNEPA